MSAMRSPTGPGTMGEHCWGQEQGQEVDSGDSRRVDKRGMAWMAAGTAVGSRWNGEEMPKEPPFIGVHTS